MTDHYIKCRAQLGPACLHNLGTRSQFGEDLPMHEDGTFDGETIVCDPCYVALMPLTPSGHGLLHELPAAIVKAKSVVA